MSENLVDAQRDDVMTPLCPNGQLYTVRSGDTLFFIARRFNISLQSLINANPQITDPNTIYPGQVICIPSATPGPGVPCPGGQIYRVVSGDTLFGIAQRFGVTLDALIRANPQITNPDRIFPGQEICVPAPPPVPCPGGTLYVVRAGDTLFEIARAHNITLAALIAANPQISDPNRIVPGQIICIPPRPSVEPPVTLPITMPPTMPIVPCPPGPMPQPAPVYVVIPWEECPFRQKKKKKKGHHKKCCH